MISKLEKANAMMCFGKLIAQVEQDPDPEAQNKLQAEFNCAGCEFHEYCCTLADTLEDKTKGK